MQTREAPAEKLIEATGLRGSVLQGRAGTPLHRPPRSTLHSSPISKLNQHKSLISFFPRVKQQIALPLSGICCSNGMWRTAGEGLDEWALLVPRGTAANPSPTPCCPAIQGEATDRTHLCSRKEACSKHLLQAAVFF